MLRLLLVPTLVVALVANGCQEAKSKTSDYRAKVCVDVASGRRAVQAPCDRAESGFAWRYFPGDKLIPAVGKKVPGGGGAKVPNVAFIVRIPDDASDVTAERVALNS